MLSGEDEDDDNDDDDAWVAGVGKVGEVQTSLFT